MSSMSSQQPSRQRPAAAGQHLGPDHDVAGEVILGVDTHKDIHVGAVISSLGVLPGSRDFPATAAGYRRLLAWARTHGPIRRAGVEGTASYGAALTRMLRGAGIKVIEVNRPNRQNRRRRGKTDRIDAEAAARAVLAGRPWWCPSPGPDPSNPYASYGSPGPGRSRPAPRPPTRSTRWSTPPPTRESVAGLSHAPRRWPRPSAGGPAPTTAPRRSPNERSARWPAGGVTSTTRSAPSTATSKPSSTRSPPTCWRSRGVGYETAGQLLITAGDNPHRLANERAFAALCGTSPGPGLERKTNRYRVNRGGDRHANSALWTITLARMSCHQPTRDYVTRRTTEGLSKREIMRCLKRYIARELYPLITSPPAQTIPVAAATAS